MKVYVEVMHNATVDGRDWAYPSLLPFVIPREGYSYYELELDLPDIPSIYDMCVKVGDTIYRDEQWILTPDIIQQEGCIVGIVDIDWEYNVKYTQEWWVRTNGQWVHHVVPKFN